MTSEVLLLGSMTMSQSFCLLRLEQAGHTTPEILATAWLHDVLEDTAQTRDSIEVRGIPPRVITAVEAMTKTNGEPYLDYLGRVAAATLGISAVSIDRLVKRGLLRPSMALRRPLFPIWEIERFLRDTSHPVDIGL